MGRPGKPDDIGVAVAALLTHDSQWMRGQRIEVSGGMFLQFPCLSVAPAKSTQPCLNRPPGSEDESVTELGVQSALGS